MTEKEKVVKASTPMRKRQKGTIGVKIGKISALKKYAEYGFEYRVMKGDEARLYEKTKNDDWESVKDPETKEVIRVLVGKNEDGSPRYDVLCRKKSEWFEEDKKAAQSLLDDTEKELLRGINKKAHGTLEADTTYIPDQDGKGNRIERKLERIERN